MKKIKKIRIINAKYSYIWYVRFVGSPQELDVEHDDGKDCFVKIDNFTEGLVYEGDYEITEWEEMYYRPFKNALEFSPHKERWFAFLNQSTYVKAFGFNNGGIWVQNEWVSYNRLFKEAIFEDDKSLCGTTAWKTCTIKTGKE